MTGPDCRFVWARTPVLLCLGLAIATSALADIHEEPVTSGSHVYTVEVGGTMDEFNSSLCGHPTDAGYRCQPEPNVFFEIANVGSTNVVNPRVVINGRRRWFTQSDIVNEIFGGGGTAREKTFALWNWCRRNISGGPTYGPPLWSDRSIVLFMNSFGTGACGTYHRVMALSGVWGGVETWGGCQASCSHSTQKEYYDGAFRYFDCMLSSGDGWQTQGYFCLGLDNRNVVGTEELAQDHYLSDRVGTVSQFYWMTSLFGGPGENYGKEDNWTDPWSMNITLRPGEALQHTWRMQTVLWDGNSGGEGTNANGQVHYEPVLTASGVGSAAETATNLAYTTLGGEPAVSVNGNNNLAQLGYVMNSPYVLVGGRMGMTVDVPDGCPPGCVKLLMRFDGGGWNTVWTSSQTGTREVSVDFGNHAAFRDPNVTHRFHALLEMNSGSGVSPAVRGLWIDAVFQSYVLALPALGVGTTTVEYSDQAGSRSVRITHEWNPSGDVPPPSAPAAPIHPVHGGEAGFNDLFEWEPSTADASYPVDKYEFFLSERSDLAWPLLTSMQHIIHGATSSLFLPTPDALIDGATYYWRVRARNTEGLWGEWSDTWSFTARGPGQPRNLPAQVDTGQGTVVLTWDPPSAGQPVTAYEVYGDTQYGFTPLREDKRQCSLSCDSWSRVFPANLIATVTGESIDVTGRNEAYYRICAVDADGNRSVASSYVGVHTPLLSPVSPPVVDLYEPFAFTINCTRRGGNYVTTLSSGMILQGADTIRYEITSGPAWMDIDYESGEVTGFANEVGLIPFTVRVTDGSGGSDTRTYTIEVVGDPNAPTPTAGPTLTPTPYAGSACLGTGRDGTVDLSEAVTWSQPHARVLDISGRNLALGTVAGEGTFSPGDEVMVIQMMHAAESLVGTYEFAYVSAYDGTNLALSEALALPFAVGTSDRVQVLRIPQYTEFRVRVDGSITAPAWDGDHGGIIAFRATREAFIQGSISASGKGYRGTGGGQGEGYPAGPGAGSSSSNGNGGGMGLTDGYCSGGGGGHAGAGGSGTADGGGTPGDPGLPLGTPDLSRLTLGGGGGTGHGPQFNCCCSGTGGGIILISAGSIKVEGSVESNGTNGAGQGGCGGPGPDSRSGGPGGGAGGSIALEAHGSIFLGYSQTTARGGSGGSGSNGGPAGGRGADGRIAVYSESDLEGATVPGYEQLWSLCPNVLPPPTPTRTPYMTPTPYTGDACLGTGADGPLTITSNTTWSAPRARVLDIPSLNTLRLGSVSGSGLFAAGDEVLVLQMYHPNAERVGTYEFARVASYAAPDLGILGGLANSYDTTGAAQVQVVRVPNHTTVQVSAGAVVSAPGWDGSTGGVIAFRASGEATVAGTLSASAKGYRGTGGGQGEGYTGPGGGLTAAANGNGGGQGQSDGYCSGGGGGHAGQGESGGCSSGGTPGLGGLAVGAADLSRLTMGGGGGTGLGPYNNCCCSGAGGGIIVISAANLSVLGGIESNGANGAGVGACGGPGPDHASGGVGGGAGGCIAIEAHSSLDLGTGWVTAWGGSGGPGAGGPAGGNGSEGRIAARCDGTIIGWTSPTHETLLSLCPQEPVATPTPMGSECSVMTY